MSIFNGIIVYVDMDRDLCDYGAGWKRHQERFPNLEFPQSQPGLYVGLDPMPGALDTMERLNQSNVAAALILSAPSVKNPHSYPEKKIWVEKHMGMSWARRLILSHFKGLHRGDYPIDEFDHGKGQEYFEGELIHFGSDVFPDWNAVTEYLIQSGGLR